MLEAKVGKTIQKSRSQEKRCSLRKTSFLRNSSGKQKVKLEGVESN